MSARTRRAIAGACTVATLVLAACSSDESGGQGEGDDGGGEPGACGALEASEAGGEAVLGTGNEVFEPLADELGIIAGPQGGFHLNLNARIRGLEFGNIEDLLDPENPSTSFAVYRADTDERIDMADCAVRLGYRADEEEFGVLQRGVSVILDAANEMEVEPLFDQPARIEVDIVDADGRHTRDEQTVTLRPPTGPPVPP